MADHAYSQKRIYSHPETIKLLQKDLPNKPIQVRIKPINACNHDCFFCAYASSSRKSKIVDTALDHLDTRMHDQTDLTNSIPSARLIALIQEIYNFGVKSITLSGGGEPTIHPAFFETIELANKLGLDTSIITNGSLIKDKWLPEMLKMKWIRISIDYSNEKQIQNQRNLPESEFARILSNIKKLVMYRDSTNSDTEIGINFIVHQNNLIDMEKMVEKLTQLKVDNIRFSPMWLRGFSEYHSSIAEEVKDKIKKLQASNTKTKIYSTYNLDVSEHFDERPLQQCFIQKLVPVIGADMYIYRCHHTAFTDHGRLESIENQSFESAWMKLFEGNAFTLFDPSKSCRHQCVYDQRNKEILDAMKAGCPDSITTLSQDKFVNFL